MSESFVECLVKAKKSMLMAVVKIILIIVTIYFGLLVCMGNIYALIFAIPALIGSYFAHLYKEVEYEYLYVDREIGIDKILARSKRKKVETLYLDKVQILAPIDSSYLDEYKSQNLKVTNYAASVENEEQKRYVLIYEGNRKIILSLTPRLVNAIKSVIPRKVFKE